MLRQNIYIFCIYDTISETISNTEKSKPRQTFSASRTDNEYTQGTSYIQGSI